MISEGLYDTEDWSSGCWKCRFVITRINYILKYIKSENGYKCNNISQYCSFDQINAALVILRDF